MPNLPWSCIPKICLWVLSGTLTLLISLSVKRFVPGPGQKSLFYLQLYVTYSFYINNLQSLTTCLKDKYFPSSILGCSASESRLSSPWRPCPLLSGSQGECGPSAGALLGTLFSYEVTDKAWPLAFRWPHCYFLAAWVWTCFAELFSKPHALQNCSENLRQGM